MPRVAVPLASAKAGERIAAPKEELTLAASTADLGQVDDCALRLALKILS
jgi:hypothetical protein